MDDEFQDAQANVDEDDPVESERFHAEDSRSAQFFSGLSELYRNESKYEIGVKDKVSVLRVLRWARSGVKITSL